MLTTTTQGNRLKRTVLIYAVLNVKKTA